MKLELCPKCKQYMRGECVPCKLYGKFDGCEWEGKPFRDMTKLELMEALYRMAKWKKSEMEERESALKLLGSGLR